ncbi:MAG: DUF488 domain-containing protein [Candidatus Aureabacteria bacterium]|nr:DUF488 domain-containing protein [Candidatus Auribacterota bacterium]
MKAHDDAVPLLYTIGHFTRRIDDFLSILKIFKVRRVLDVRTVPRSRYNPQFNQKELEECLKAEGIAYTHMPGLGGLRRSRGDSLNTAWRNATFRGFADYMQTSEFLENIEKLVDISKTERVALMCAEAVPWRCHRSLIADALQVRGIHVEHIMSRTRPRPHVLTPFVKVDGVQVTYPLAG